MPILPPEYISTWYYFRDGAGYIRLFESWKETESQDVKQKPLIQGDIGTHVMDVGGLKWVTSIKSPALIIEDAVNTADHTTDVFDLIKYAFDNVRDPSRQALENYILKNATINISQEGVNCDVTFHSSVPGAFNPNYAVEILNPDFIGRVARFYDTYFSVTDSNLQGSYPILSGTISIDVELSENYFINTQSQAPYFGVQGYHINGSVVVAATPAQFANFDIPTQLPGQLVTTTATSSLQVGTAYLGLGQSQIRKTAERTMSPGAITQVKVDFETYTRYTTPVA